MFLLLVLQGSDPQTVCEAKIGKRVATFDIIMLPVAINYYLATCFIILCLLLPLLQVKCVDN